MRDRFGRSSAVSSGSSPSSSFVSLVVQFSQTRAKIPYKHLRHTRDDNSSSSFAPLPHPPFLLAVPFLELFEAIQADRISSPLTRFRGFRFVDRSRSLSRVCGNNRATSKSVALSLSNEHPFGHRSMQVGRGTGGGGEKGVYLSARVHSLKARARWRGPALRAVESRSGDLILSK